MTGVGVPAIVQSDVYEGWARGLVETMEKHRILSRKIKLMCNFKYVYPEVIDYLIHVNLRASELALSPSTHPVSMKSSGMMTGTAISSVPYLPARQRGKLLSGVLSEFVYLIDGNPKWLQRLEHCVREQIRSNMEQVRVFRLYSKGQLQCLVPD